jgi:hypothetical protein
MNFGRSRLQIGRRLFEPFTQRRFDYNNVAERSSTST